MNDEQYMQIALEQAAKARPSPNPKVGCVIVKQGKIIARAYHRKAGQPHAEILALRKAGKHAQGATMYVTLEPCGHYGRTPPCTDALIRSGVKKVVSAIRDPNPLVKGKGFAQLVKQGISVKYGVLQTKAEELNRYWIHFITKKTSYVIAKIAQTLDGKICTRTGDSRWITGKESRAFVHTLRAQVDAVLVGIGTILKDDPRLTAHGKGRDPVRVILDGRLRIPIHARVLKDKRCVIVTQQKSGIKKKMLERKGVKVIALQNMRWRTILAALARQRITSVLIEGGSEVFTSAFEQKAINELYWFIAPKIIGGEQAKTTIEGKGVQKMQFARNVKRPEVQHIGTDYCIHGFL